MKYPQVSAFHRLRIVCPDLSKAILDLQILFGVSPAWQGRVRFKPVFERDSQHTDEQSCCAWFVMGNTILEIFQLPVKNPKLIGLVLESELIQMTGENVYQSAIINEQRMDLEFTRNLWISVEDGKDSGAILNVDSAVKPANEHKNSAIVTGVDHVVLHTNDADDCIRLFGEQGLGIRLALDKNAPEWGGRMLFFRAGKLTLEIIEPNERFEGDDHFWGIAYQVEDIHAVHQRLSEAGVVLTKPRKGRKPGTFVATVKSHQLGIPTLLLQHYADQ